jgi:hypothetical protein
MATTEELAASLEAKFPKYKTVIIIIAAILSLISTGLSYKFYSGQQTQATTIATQQATIADQQIQVTALKDDLQQTQLKAAMDSAQLAMVSGQTDLATQKVAEAQTAIATIKTDNAATFKLVQDMGAALTNFTNSKTTGQKNLFLNLAIQTASALIQQRLAK